MKGKNISTMKKYFTINSKKLFITFLIIWLSICLIPYLPFLQGKFHGFFWFILNAPLSLIWEHLWGIGASSHAAILLISIINGCLYSFIFTFIYGVMKKYRALNQ